jgi:iron complex outermembrane receptor protein
MQLTVQAAAPPPFFFSSQVVNAGTAEMTGFEVEALLQASDKFSTSLSVGRLNSDLVEVLSGGVDVSSSWELLNAPDWTGQLAFNYQTELGNKGTLAMHTALSYRGASRNFNNVPCSCDQDESYTLIDASANWYSNDGRWTVGLFLNNIGDEDYRTGGYNLGSGELAFYGNPRTWTVSLGYEF